MKFAYVENGVVVGTAHIPDSSASMAQPSGPVGSVEYQVADEVNVQPGFTCTVEDGEPVFAAPAAVQPDLDPMVFYDAFQVGEALAIKNSADPVIQECWFRVQTAISTNTPINPAVVTPLLEYAAAVNQRPNPGTGIYLSGALTTVPAWVANTPVAAGASLAVGDTVFTYSAAGTTGATAPSGTGAGIEDGTATCSYIATPYIQPSRIAQILAGQPATA